MTSPAADFAPFSKTHLLGISDLSPLDIENLLDRANAWADRNALPDNKHAILRGRTHINLFF